MSKIKLNTHLKAFRDLTELMSVAFLLALVADACWVIRDMVVHEVTSGMVIIATCLWTSVAIVTYALYRYHVGRVRDLFRELMNEKLAHQKRKQKNRNKLTQKK